MDFPPDIALLLGRLRDGLVARGGLAGIYVYGSLVTGDFSPACSDIDVVVMLKSEPGSTAVQELKQLHAALASMGGAVDRLHCLYVPVETVSDPARLHTYWFGDRMTHWQLKVLTPADHEARSAEAAPP